MGETYRVLVTGSREYRGSAVLREISLLAIEHGRDNLVVVHGAARSGADKLADMAAKALGIRVEPHAADWGRYNKRAGYIRNEEMVALGADLTLVFALQCAKASCQGRAPHDTHGTAHCAQAARKAGIPVRRIDA